jgi:hypothetical protein
VGCHRDDKSPRGGFRFGLASLLVMIAVAAVPMAWAANPLNWIRQRQAILNRQPGWWPPGTINIPEGSLIQLPIPLRDLRITAPGWLGLFGESGYQVLFCVRNSIASQEEMRRLFPEAQIILVD